MEAHLVLLLCVCVYLQRMCWVKTVESVPSVWRIWCRERPLPGWLVCVSTIKGNSFHFIYCLIVTIVWETVFPDVRVWRLNFGFKETRKQRCFAPVHASQQHNQDGWFLTSLVLWRLFPEDMAWFLNKNATSIICKLAASRQIPNPQRPATIGVQMPNFTTKNSSTSLILIKLNLRLRHRQDGDRHKIVIRLNI